MNIKHIIMTFLAISFLSACDNDDVDTTKPHVEIISPENQTHYHAGDEFRLKALITDNEALASWKVSVHYNADGHTHKSASILAEEEVEWQQDWSANMEAGLASFELVQTITVPANAKHGQYHLGVFALDKSGNEQVVFIEIEVKDTEHVD